MIYEDPEIMFNLSELKYRRADNYIQEQSTVIRKYYLDYKNNDINKIARLIGKYGVNHRDQFNLTPVLAAIQAGSEKVIRFLLEQGADITLSDNRGRNALRTAISQKLLKTTNDRVTGLILSLFIADTIKLKIENKLVVIPSRKFEYMLLNVFLAVQKHYFIPHKFTFWWRCMNALSIEEAVDNYPEQMVPDFRKKRAYISSMLSKNEILGTNPYNNKTFFRIARGEYMLNPDMEMMVNDKWINVYDVIGMDKPKIPNPEERFDNLRQQLQHSMDENKDQPESEQDYYDQESYIQEENSPPEENEPSDQIHEIKKNTKEKKNKAIDPSQLKLPF